MRGRIEAVFRDVVSRAEEKRFRLPQDIDSVKWVIDQLLHWLAEEASQPIEDAVEAIGAAKAEIAKDPLEDTMDLDRARVSMEKVEETLTLLRDLLGVQ